MAYSNKNKVMFGRGSKSMTEFQEVAGWQNMIYFNTTTSEIYVGEKTYGFSEDDRALLGNGGIKEASFDVAKSQLIITLNSQNADKSYKTVSVDLPVADSKTPGLMTSTQVTALANASAAILKLDGDGEGSVKKAQADAEAYAKGLVDSVLSEDVDAAGAAIVKISQNAEGKIVAEKGDVEAAHVTVADTAGKYNASDVEGVFAEIATKIASLDNSAEGVDGKISAAIDKLNFNAPSTGGEFVTVTVVQEKGEITSVTVNDEGIASAQSVSDLSNLVGEGFNNSDKTVAKEVARVEALVSTLETEKVDKNTAAIAQEVKDREDAVSKAVEDITGDLGEGEAATLAGIHDRIDTVAAAAGAISYKIEKIAEEDLETNVKEAFKLVNQNGDVADSQVIKIYKDSSLDSVELVDENKEGTKGQFLKFVYITSTGDKNPVYVNVSSFLAESEFKNGLQVSQSGEVSVLKDSSSEDFLSVSENGVKVSGIQDAINSAVNTLNLNLLGDASEGYKTFGDIEDEIKKNAAAAAAAQTRISDKTDGFITVSSSTDSTTGAVTYTINESDDIASAGDLIALTNKVGAPVNGTIAQDIADAKKATTDLANGAVADNTSAIALLNEDDEDKAGTVKNTAKGYADAAKEAAINAANAYTDAALYWYEG